MHERRDALLALHSSIYQHIKCLCNASPIMMNDVLDTSLHYIRMATNEILRIKTTKENQNLPSSTTFKINESSKRYKVGSPPFATNDAEHVFRKRISTHLIIQSEIYVYDMFKWFVRVFDIHIACV